MPCNSSRFDLSGLGGFVVLAFVIVLAWWLLGAILSMSVGNSFCGRRPGG
jgi:hypothetical protein